MNERDLIRIRHQAYRDGMRWGFHVARLDPSITWLEWVERNPGPAIEYLESLYDAAQEDDDADE